MGQALWAPVAIVTGAASGIGAATATMLAGRGYVVACVDQDSAGAERTAADAPGEAYAISADVSDDSSCRDAVTAAATMGPVRLLCNIAGVAPKAVAVTDMTPAEWDHTFAVNVRSIYSMSRHAIPMLSRARPAVIVNTASVHAYASQPGSAAYAATKGAIVSLTRQMAIDLTASGIRVVAVAPGSVDTQMSQASAASRGMSLEQLGFSSDPMRLGRTAQPDEVGEVICWLASTSASFVNGSTLLADGGLLAPLPTAPTSSH